MKTLHRCVIKTVSFLSLHQVIKFETPYLRDNFLQGFEEFVQQVGGVRKRITMALKPALQQAVTRKDRQKRLEMFFRVVFSQVCMNIQHWL
jgi:hypothetical protein